jgi:hypothetical protein
VSRFIVGQSTTRPSPGEAPIRLPVVAFLWTVVTSVTFYAWRECFKNSGGAQAPPVDAGGRTIFTYFRVGWHEDFVFFGVPVDSWTTYTVLMCYQITRSIITSLLDHVFAPFMSRVSAPGECSDEDFRITDEAIFYIQAGKALTTVASTWSSFSNFALTFTQVDLAAVSLIVTILADASYLSRSLRAKMMRASCSGKPPLRGIVGERAMVQL